MYIDWCCACFGSRFHLEIALSLPLSPYTIFKYHPWGHGDPHLVWSKDARKMINPTVLQKVLKVTLIDLKLTQDEAMATQAPPWVASGSPKNHIAP